MLPGERVRSAEPPHEVTVLPSTNTASVPIWVTSPLPLLRGQPAARFDRRAAYGMRLDVPAGRGAAVRPGRATEVALVPIGGERVAIGFAGLVDGPLDAPGAAERALRGPRACGYRDPDVEAQR